MCNPELKNKYSDVRVMVLGASGFIGRWVARSLNVLGANIFLVVRDKSTSAKIFQEYGISGEVIEIDLLDFKSFYTRMLEIRPSITFNLAGYGVDRSERNQEMAYQINAHLVNVICETIHQVRDRNWLGQDIVHVGSALEYGTLNGNLREDSNCNPTTLYGESKLAGTVFLTECCKFYSLKGLTARLFTVYGPGERKSRLLPSLFDLTLEDNGVLELTSGKQRRDFVYVKDVAEGLLRLGVAVVKAGEIVNLASGKLTAVKEFSETAASILGVSNKRLNFGTLSPREEEMCHSEVAVQRLKQLTHWQPNADIAIGVRRAFEFLSGLKSS